jgi:iron complex transport system permease protein
VVFVRSLSLGVHNVRAGALGLAGIIALASTVVIALSVGAVGVPLGEVAAALVGRASSLDADQIVVGLRLPRAVLGIIVGGSLAVVGTTLQATMRSPLADPYILGLSAGASVGAAVAALLFPDGALAVLGAPVASFLAALASVACVFGAARSGGRLPPVRLLLAGVAFSSFASALTGFIVYLAPEDGRLRGFVFWTLGGLSAADWPLLRWAAPVMLGGTLLLGATARWQNLLVLGDDAALSLGLDVARARTRLVVLSAIVTGAAVAASGAIGFVGLVVPHVIRRFVGPEHARLIPLSFLFGATLLLAMDTLARIAIAPRELPVGLLTGLLGAPFFLVLLRRRFGEGG